jgi:hypothetical protein
MLSEYDIYKIFRQEQSSYINRPYRMPKKWDDFFSKMALNKKDPLITITKFFNTKWSNIDPNVYFKMGFKIFAHTFSYHRFFDRKIMELYITEDRAIKREIDGVEEDLKKSINYLKGILPDAPVSRLLRYVNMFDGKRPKALSDYLANRIGKYLLIYLIKEGYVKLASEQRGQLVYIDQQYGKYVSILTSFLQQNGSDLFEEIL